MNMKHRLIPLLAAIILVVLGLSFSVGVSVGLSSRPEVHQVADLFSKEEYKPANVDFAPFWKAWNIINEKYVSTDGLSDQKKVWGAIEGLAASLNDPYTVFFPPEELELFESGIEGNFQGVGMEVDIRDDILTVVAPLKDTPAERAGIRAGDKILQIDGIITADMNVEQAVRRIRGEKGTAVKLLIAREHEDEPLDITIVRDVITVPTIKTEFTTVANEDDTQKSPAPADGAFIIRLYNFSASSPDQFRDSLRSFVESDSDKLIIDLRGNPGGYLDAAVDMASWFLPAGKVVVKEELSKGKEGRVYRSKGYNIFNKNLNMVILMDKGSASASEILAGALHEHGIATLVGEQSFGKGSVQELVPVTENASLKITIARWLTPNGISISKAGLTPDVEIKLTKEDVKAKRDTQLLKAKEVVRNLSLKKRGLASDGGETAGTSTKTEQP